MRALALASLVIVSLGGRAEGVEGSTPYSVILRVTPPEPGSHEYFRIQITKPYDLLSSPIFVRRQA